LIQASTSKGAEPQREVVREEEEQEEEAGQWVWEPMLCGEAEGGKVPHSLEVLYHQAQSSSTCDALMVAVHLLMLETGFLCQVSLYKRRGGETDRQSQLNTTRIPLCFLPQNPLEEKVRWEGPLAFSSNGFEKEARREDARSMQSRFSLGYASQMAP
jgi:hypothetical protein